MKKKTKRPNKYAKKCIDCIHDWNNCKTCTYEKIKRSEVVGYVKLPKTWGKSIPKVMKETLAEMDNYRYRCMWEKLKKWAKPELTGLVEQMNELEKESES